MQLTSYRVRKFRNIIDSGPISVDLQTTCLVGKNEAGKSGLLEALYLCNPAYGESFSVEDQYPRWLTVQDRKQGDLSDATPVEVTFALSDADRSAVNDELGPGALTGENLTITKKYSGELVWAFEHDIAAAVAFLCSQFAKPVQAAIGKPTTLAGINEALEAIATSEIDHDIQQEMITEARQVLTASQLDTKSIWDRMVSILNKNLPKFFRFTNYSTLPGRIDFRELTTKEEDGPATSGLQTARALLGLAGTDLDQLGNDDYELRKAELEAVQIDLTNQVFEYWKQNPNLEVLIDVDKDTVQKPSGQTAVSRFLDIRLKDKRTGYSNNFEQRSSGFQWFFSFLAAFSEFEGDQPTIVLLDEPALTLHGKAQSDFLRFIRERLSPHAQVLYTTHSPFMVEADHLDRVRIIEDHGPPQGATATEDVLVSDRDSLFPLQAALGYDIAQNLFVGPHNLVVEGTSDFIYLTTMSGLCGDGGRTVLDARWRMLPAGGATNIPTFVALIGPHLDVTVLADSDTKGMQRVQGMIEKGLLKNKRLIFPSAVLDSANADIEDLFSEDDYLKLYNKTFSTSIRLANLDPGDRIVKRIERSEGEFDHGRVAESLLRHHHELVFTDTTYERFARLFAEINKTIEA